MPLEQDDDDQVLYDEDIAAAPASEPEASAPVVAPAANGLEPPPHASAVTLAAAGVSAVTLAAAGVSAATLGAAGVKAFPLEQLPTAMLEDTPQVDEQPSQACAAEAVPSAELPSVPHAAPEGGMGSSNAVPSDKGAALAPAAFNDNMYWKSTYMVEIPDDI